MSNNPFSVPESPPALVDPPKSRAKSILHRIAFVLILVAWYGVLLLSPREALRFLLAFHAVIIAELYDGNKSLFQNPDAYTPLLWLPEIAFVGLICFTMWRRSFTFTLSVLAFVTCWSLVNIVYAFLLFADYFK